ncbi:MAG: NnrS family protein [Propionivibrio sp.]|uniref:NnrS family protein n=1 Tax=Propionivibrio sp. TaxID=2212460 RepID=UPI001A5947AC|nr:NnrS family protein [Propionivibrio sp.]MBL8416540.1 NnrS family protein [Propionivibrio sp.]
MNEPLHQPTKPEYPVETPGFALWNLGFRPFYLLASLFSAFSVLLWAAQFSGLIPEYLPGPIWHGHEMIFGYTTAVIAGFLLTAVRAWTNQPTPSGVPLMALAALWVGGRILVLTPWFLAATLVNAAFPVAVAVAIAIPLLRARNTRNYFFVGLLVLMSALIVTVHLALRGSFELSPRLGLQLALDVILFIMVVIGGRVIPMFTNNGIPGTNAMRHPWVERIALGTVILLFVADFLQLPQAVIAMVALISALAHGWRLFLWKSWRTLATPLVWVLHAAYAWIVVYLLLRGLTALDLLTGSFAAHALTVGAIGGLTLGMMTRTARGHTGRPLVADGFEIAMFLLIQAAAIIRVFGGIASPGLYMASIELSGLLWFVAFGLYIVRYWPVLARPRLDGKPG